MSGASLRTLVTSVGGAKGTPAVAAAAAVEAAGDSGTAVLFEITSARPRPATVVGSAHAREIGIKLDPVPDGVVVRIRGRICLVTIPEDSPVPVLRELLARTPRGTPWVICAPAARYREILDDQVGLDAILIRADRTDDVGSCALLELTLREAATVAARVEVIESAPSRLAGRRALAGSSGPARRQADPKRVLPRLLRQRGQATPLVIGAVFVLVLGSVALVAIAGAITGKARAQTVADLSALSAARSMKDDLPRLLAPPTLPNGLPNPAHMSKVEYLARARLTAVRIAVGNGASPLRVAVRFPDGYSFAPVTARVSLRSTVNGRGSTRDWAEARVGAPVSTGSVPAVATGGGYSGPLAERQGHGMRPDVAAAFDAMSSAAAAAGVSLSINSAFRSDAEQATLFAANPNPTMVARPGTSLHRCGTELDLGASDGYVWLAANAGRFGFLQRYSWEAWHYGFTAGPEPCSGAGNRVGAGGDPGQTLTGSLPGFVPERFRKPILAAAMKWNVSAALLAAQIYAESNFDPNAGSPAGAQGIAQFMPATATSYGLDDPYDPVAAIDAQGHLMSDLLKQFGSPGLALAAYNAGPGAVAPCGCIPPYAETQTYVAKILALLGGAGAIVPVLMEVELVR